MRGNGPGPMRERPGAGRGIAFVCLSRLYLASCASPGNCSKLVPPVPIRQAGPQVPAGFWDKHEAGVVQLRLQIGNDGSVLEPRVVSSPGHDYSVIALEAVR